MALALSAGDTYGNFKIERKLRDTSRFSIYEAVAQNNDERVQLKISSDPVASEEAARRALRELAVLGELTNAHVQRLHDSGLGDDERWFLVLEHLEGAQLDRWHDFDRPLDVPTVISFLHQACLGIAELHAKGVVHRDLKPSSLWVEPNGNVKLLDFSSARSWDEQSETGDSVTTTHGMAGSPQYAAPETALSSELTPATDVYAIGQIAYELLTGRAPFWADKPRSKVVRQLEDEPVEWMMAHARKPVTPMSQLDLPHEVPAKLEALIMKMLDKTAAARPESAGVVANELGWIMHHVIAAAPVATVLVTEPNGAVQYHLLTPGSHRVGFGKGCEIDLRKDGDDKPYALIEWRGQGNQAELRAMDDAKVTRNGQPVTARTALDADDRVAVEGFSLQVTYPR